MTQTLQALSIDFCANRAFIRLKYSVVCVVEHSSRPTRLIPEVDNDYRVVQNNRTADSLFKYFSS